MKAGLGQLPAALFLAAAQRDQGFPSVLWWQQLMEETGAKHTEPAE